MVNKLQAVVTWLCSLAVFSWFIFTFSGIDSLGKFLNAGITFFNLLIAAIEKITKLDIIGDDKKLIEGYVAIIKEMSIKHGVGLAA